MMVPMQRASRGGDRDGASEENAGGDDDDPEADRSEQAGEEECQARSGRQPLPGAARLARIRVEQVPEGLPAS
jgi:hypothetical protein